MKANVFSVTVVFLFLFLKLPAQDQPKDYIWRYQGKNKTKTIGLYGGINYSYNEVMSKPAGFLGYKAGIVFNNNFGVGFAGSALHFDRHMDELSEFGTYRLEAGYAGMFVEYIQPVGNRLRLNFYLISGGGLVKYKYDKEYSEDLIWYQEILDQDEFAVFEPGMEVNVRIAKKWWIGLNGSFRTTSPLDLEGTDENLLESLSGGVCVKFGIF